MIKERHVRDECHQNHCQIGFWPRWKKNLRKLSINTIFHFVCLTAFAIFSACIFLSSKILISSQVLLAGFCSTLAFNILTHAEPKVDFPFLINSVNLINYFLRVQLVTVNLWSYNGPWKIFLIQIVDSVLNWDLLRSYH